MHIGERCSNFSFYFLIFLDEWVNQQICTCIFMREKKKVKKRRNGQLSWLNKLDRTADVICLNIIY